MKILILDDNQTRHNGFARVYPDADRVHVYSATQAIRALDGVFFDLVTLDHDLSDLASDNRRSGRLSYSDWVGDGQDVARHIAAMAPWRRPGCIVIHSWNPDGARAMAAILRRAGVSSIMQPYGEVADEHAGPVEVLP